MAMKQIRSGDAPTKSVHRILKTDRIDTKLGPMLAIADEKELFLLEFIDRGGLEREIERLRERLKVTIIPGNTAIIKRIKAELTQYFDGEIMRFKTPIHLFGSDFQKTVWHSLQKIPVGETRSYLDIAKAIQKPTAYRAVAQANDYILYFFS